MAIKKYDSDQNYPSMFSNLLENFFGRDMLEGNEMSGSLPAVNVNEGKDNFKVEVAAPGMKKEDFHLDVDNGILTISAEHKEENKKEEDGKYTRREFNYSSFRRSFTIPDSVNADDIKAKYQDGVLNITLPKKEEAKEKPKRKINIE